MTITDEDFQRLLDKRRRRDAKLLIRTIMETPLEDGPVTEVDGKISIKALSKKNLDVQTRIMLTMAGQASGGDVKAAEFLMKYGGYTPPVEQNVTVNLPRIINDLEFQEEQMLEAAVEALDEPKEMIEDDEGTKKCETV